MTAPEKTPRARKARIQIDPQHPTRLAAEPLEPLPPEPGEPTAEPAEEPAAAEPAPAPAPAARRTARAPRADVTLGVAAGGTALPKLTAKPRRGEPVNWTYYRPSRDEHVTKVGEIALGNFIGYVEGVPVRVYFGAPRSTVPQVVAEAMAKAGVLFGLLPKRDPQGKPQRPQAALLGLA